MKKLEYFVAGYVAILGILLLIHYYTRKDKEKKVITNKEYEVIIKKLDSIQEVQNYLIERSWRQDEAILKTQMLIKNPRLSVE